MSASEYLAFLPLLIYGIALADLFRQWNRFLNFKQVYLPYLLLTIILTETALYNVFIFEGLLTKLEGLSYANYLLYLLPPFIFLLATIFFTPDEGSDTKEYFIKHLPVFNTLFALYVSSHFLHEFNEPLVFALLRISGIIIILSAGFLRKPWLIYLFTALWVFSLFFKGAVTTA